MAAAGGMWYDGPNQHKGVNAVRIAVVDDCAADREQLRGELERLLARRRLEGTVAAFDSGEAFLSAAREGPPFTLAFLDVYMEPVDGLETARALRRFDRECLLVLSTSSRDHALEGYRVQAVQYLVKPYGLADLEALFAQLERLLPRPESYVELRAGRQTVRVRLEELLWAEHFQHQVRVHTAGGGEVSSRLTFREFTELLSGDPRFFVCGRGLLVNLDRAADFDGRDFRLEDGTRVPVSRDLAGAARSAFGDRLFRRGEGAAL